MHSSNALIPNYEQDNDEKMVEDLLSGPLSPEVSFSSDACDVDLDNDGIPILNPLDFGQGGADLDGDNLNVVVAMRDQVMFTDINQYNQVSEQPMTPPPHNKRMLPFPK
ncbi:hypothetical protein GSI_01743 [Ganoderma sinense ZZ0214-1]|uniref:Uncharacterized protein n=1 Tax=Ganoderma sinense ZZ0214-1 TaxID=1077348 RepID=A0A2G8SQU5_9APHY|nr:hypothetical protein GSI_01743 [Ganoderma sinense ZZ0214-1]